MFCRHSFIWTFFRWISAKISGGEILGLYVDQNTLFSRVNVPSGTEYRFELKANTHAPDVVAKLKIQIPLAFVIFQMCNWRATGRTSNSKINSK